MTEEPTPVLNSPAETDGVAAEEFKKNLIGRMDRSHEAHTQLNRAVVESREHAQERFEKFKQEFIARFSEMTGLSFDANGRCTTPGKVKMEGEVKERWLELCTELGASQNPDETLQLWQEAGRLLLGATATPDPLTHDETSTDVTGN